MKMTPEYQKAQQNMQAGVITADGFLGDDRRPLLDIIEHDEETMKELDLDFEILTARMRYLMEEGRKGLGEPVTIDNKWIVRVDEARGYLPSPFEDGIFRKVNAEVELLVDGKASGKTLVYTEMSLHLIEKYHFFEGKGSPFRLEPLHAKAILGL
ncbi:hypothetical protein [Spirochaeta lutea]|uniref:Uncharacterized protein n=1 Tax=Spirochaeta lutea TaxID=1480694 RepID=A0A098R0F9_9SPIO|nr:hypothetical protein [Spirochaeta lutea]KGE73173.1 hypothetical protein DC28_05190 [Spirochaeta lutea]